MKLLDPVLSHWNAIWFHTPEFQGVPIAWFLITETSTKPSYWKPRHARINWPRQPKFCLMSVLVPNGRQLHEHKLFFIAPLSQLGISAICSFIYGMPCPTTFKNAISCVLRFPGMYRTDSVLCLVTPTTQLLLSYL